MLYFFNAQNRLNSLAMLAVHKNVKIDAEKSLMN
jgi:hypothetical protein